MTAHEVWMEQSVDGTWCNWAARATVTTYAQQGAEVVEIEVTEGDNEPGQWRCLGVDVALDVVRELHRALGEAGGVNISGIAIESFRGYPGRVEIRGYGELVKVAAVVESHWPVPAVSRSAWVPRAELAEALAEAIRYHDDYQAHR